MKVKTNSIDKLANLIRIELDLDRIYIDDHEYSNVLENPKKTFYNGCMGFYMPAIIFW